MTSASITSRPGPNYASPSPTETPTHLMRLVPCCGQLFCDSRHVYGDALQPRGTVGWRTIDSDHRQPGTRSKSPVVRRADTGTAPRVDVSLRVLLATKPKRTACFS